MNPTRGAPATILFLIPPLLCWPAARADEVDDYVAAQMKKHHVPGLSLAVVRDGEVVKSKGYGLASVELEAPATERTVYEIGSITKQFTATAVMMLVEEGKLGLDDKISDRLPGLPAAWKEVTVRHLLTHTSGIKSYTGATDFIRLARNDYSQEQILALVSKAKLEFDPGTSWAYCNTGYFLLGMLIEKMSGQTCAKFLDERIFKPLGMASTRPNNPKAIIPRRAAGYADVFGTYFNRDPLTPTSAFSAGFLVSTVGDLVKWDAALRAGKLLSSSSFAQMYTPVTLKDGSTRPYGFGWSVGSRLGHKIIDHGGGTAGFSTMIARYVDDGLTVIVLTNLSGGAAGEVAHGIARIYLPELSVKSVKAEDDPDPAATERLKGLVADVLAGKADEPRLTAPYAKRLKADSTKRALKAVAARGAVKSLTFLRRRTEDKRPSAYYKLVVGKATYLLTVHLAEDGKVSGMSFEREDE
jgi:D-alanyl-D-alanine carboxypeptidase